MCWAAKRGTNREVQSREVDGSFTHSDRLSAPTSSVGKERVAHGPCKRGDLCNSAAAVDGGAHNESPAVFFLLQRAFGQYWHIATFRCDAPIGSLLEACRECREPPDATRLTRSDGE
jgi:hypothetical protein